MERSATFARGLFSPLLYQLSYPANGVPNRELLWHTPLMICKH